MVDAVNISQLASTPPKAVLQAISATESLDAAVSDSTAQNYTNSRIRVDNLLDLAILEYRSAETGDVIRQYPTERQIQGYQRAAQLEANKEIRTELYAGSETVASLNSGAGNNSVATETNAPAPRQQVAVASPAPALTAVTSPSTAQISDSSSVASSGSTTTQSIVV